MKMDNYKVKEIINMKGEGDYEFGRRDGLNGLHKEWDENGKLININL